MSTIVLITGLLFVGLGYLIKAYPNLIAGYNTMSKERKALVDIDGLSAYMQQCLMVMGLIMVIGFYGFKGLGFDALANATIVIVAVFGSIIMVINSQRFDAGRTQSNTITVYVILTIVLLAVAGLIGYGLMPAKMNVGDRFIQFTGMYGLQINIDDIKTVDLIDQIPKIKRRTNGYSFAQTHKGTFDLEQYGSCRMLVHGVKGPFIIIDKKPQQKLIINYKNPETTTSSFEEIRDILKG